LILNSRDLGVEEVTYVDADYFTVPISTVACDWVVGTGEITWYKPTNISGFTARCQLRSKPYSGTKIADLTTANGGVILTTNDAGIQLHILAAATEAYTFVKAYFDCELISGAGIITRAFSGIVTLTRGITR